MPPVNILVEESMKKQNITKLLVLSLAALVFLPACGGNSSSSSSSQQQQSTSSSQQQQSTSSSQEQTTATWGTKTSPLTVAEAIAKMSSFAEKEWSTEEGYVSGIVVDKYYNSNHTSYTLTIVDDLNSTSTNVFKIYSATLVSGVEEPNIGDTALGKGYFTKYNATTYEVAWSENPAHISYVEGITHNTYPVSVSSGANYTVSSIPTTAQSGDTISFTVTPAAGYVVSSVKVGGNTIMGANGDYSFIVGINNTIEVSVREETAASSTVVFDFGANEPGVIHTKASTYIPNDIVHGDGKDYKLLLCKYGLHYSYNLLPYEIAHSHNCNNILRGGVYPYPYTTLLLLTMFL